MLDTVERFVTQGTGTNHIQFRLFKAPKLTDDEKEILKENLRCSPHGFAINRICGTGSF